MSFSLALWVAAGSATGGALRYACAALIGRWFGETFPWGILFVNVAGSVLIGLLVALIGPGGRAQTGAETFHFATVGVLGGFTTFSTFSMQTLALAQGGQWIAAGLNVVASVVLCLAGVWLGFSLGARLTN